MIKQLFKRRIPLQEYTFVDHLEELRWVLVRSLIAIVIFTIVGFIYVDFFFDKVIMSPARNDFPTYKLVCWIGKQFSSDKLCFQNLNVKLQSTRMGAQFFMSFSIALVVGIILSFPYVIHNIWNFIKPALNDTEIRNTRYVTLSISILFFLGTSFGYFIVVPYSIQFFASYTLSPDIENRFMISDYVTNILQISLGSGLVFQMPLLVYFLVKLGIARVKILMKYRKHVFVGILILAAIITPPDVVSQIIVAIPLYLLYEFGIMIGRRVERKEVDNYEAG